MWIKISSKLNVSFSTKKTFSKVNEEIKLHWYKKIGLNVVDIWVSQKNQQKYKEPRNLSKAEHVNNLSNSE